MTINKSQGQIFDHVGIYLDEPVFSHGQFYVALSRSTIPNHVKIYTKTSEVQGKLLNNEKYFTRNDVYQERRGKQSKRETCPEKELTVFAAGSSESFRADAGAVPRVAGGVVLALAAVPAARTEPTSRAACEAKRGKNYFTLNKYKANTSFRSLEPHTSTS
ncbi:hypothetical protein AVEN_241637-1 [Araneus ventricosus]|uniref:(+)RNA virus helicase C-terminal domain-containing protein n=1 Tax=Araneus ventricosus TaxID=182803 RepID=A0A4Y2VY20_ARAVE|nr:hypothetical protein AVEN_241637-1 [Araneus ventricosus]